MEKVTSEKVGDVIDVSELQSGSVELLKSDMRPEKYIQVLTSAEKWSDAIKVMAHTLPRREAIWWACICARNMEVLAKNKEEALALKAAEKWVYKPTDENRRKAFLQAQKGDAPSVGTLSSLAAACSGGKLSLGEGQSADLDGSAVPQIVSTVVLISASEKEGDQANRMLESFLQNGIDIACGGSGQLKGQKG